MVYVGVVPVIYGLICVLDSEIIALL